MVSAKINVQLNVKHTLCPLNAVGARLTEPTQDTVLDITLGETTLIRCNGVGTPTPNITLISILNDNELVLRQSVGELIEASFLINVPPSFIFKCVASNYIVNASGEAELVSESYTYSFNVVES